MMVKLGEKKIYFPREIVMNPTHIQADGDNNLHVLDILNDLRLVLNG